MNKALQSPVFYLSKPHECAYFGDREASSVFLDPEENLTGDIYNQLLDLGFRRSGALVYRPQCRGCSACVSIRIDVRNMRLTRSQRRNLRKNEDVAVVMSPPRFDPDHFKVYLEYQHFRHCGGSMDNNSREQYEDFIVHSAVNTEFMECFVGDELAAVSVIDCTRDGLSAVYTFYHPVYSQRGLGNFCVLKQAEIARQRNLSWLYLGYWVDGCAKMSYKADFGPAQVYIGSRWQPAGAKR